MRKLVVLLAVALLVPALFAAKTPPPAQQQSNQNIVLGPVEGRQVAPEIKALEDQMSAALSRGDRDQARELNNEIQAWLLARQPRTEQSNLPAPRVSFVPPPGVLPLGPDVMILNRTVYATATDYQADGTMWAGCASNDSNTFFFKSTDHGVTWQFVVTVNWYFNVQRLGLVIGEGDSAFIHMFVINPIGDGDLYDLRMHLDGTGIQTYAIDIGPDTVSDFAVCRDMATPSYGIYAVANNALRTAGSRTNCHILRSLDFGKSWVWTDSLFNTVQPQISIGAGTYLYLVMLPTPAVYPGMTARLVNRLSGAPNAWTEADIQPDTFQVADPVMGAAFILPESLAVVWTVYSHNYNNSGDWDILADYSTNAGMNWSSVYTLAYTTDLESWPDLKNYASLGNDYMNASYISINTSNYRTVYRRYVEAPLPNGWSDTLRINSNSAGTGREIRPLLVYSPGAPGTGAGCVFTGAGLVNAYWNSPWATGNIAENPVSGGIRTRLFVSPVISTGLARLGFELARPGAIDLAVFDATGRRVRTLATGQLAAGEYLYTWDGQNESGQQVRSGLYFCRLVSADGSFSAKLVRTK